MKRHEYLYSAITAIVGASLFLAAAIILQKIVIAPYIKDSNTAVENFFYGFLPTMLYVFSALFYISGIYAAVIEILIEKGENIIAKVTNIQESYVGKKTELVHYNVFCEWKNPKNQKIYKYKAKNLKQNPAPKLTDGKVVVRICKSDPRQYYVDI